MPEKIKTPGLPVCFSEAQINVQLAPSAADAEMRISAARPDLISDDPTIRTYGCGVTDCTYECSFIVLADGRLRGSPMAAGICLRALTSLASPPGLAD